MLERSQSNECSPWTAAMFIHGVWKNILSIFKRALVSLSLTSKLQFFSHQVPSPQDMKISKRTESKIKQERK